MDGVVLNSTQFYDNPPGMVPSVVSALGLVCGGSFDFSEGSCVDFLSHVIWPQQQSVRVVVLDIETFLSVVPENDKKLVGRRQFFELLEQRRFELLGTVVYSSESILFSGDCFIHFRIVKGEVLAEDTTEWMPHGKYLAFQWE